MPTYLHFIYDVALFVLVINSVLATLRWSRSRKSYEATISTLEDLLEAIRRDVAAKEKLIATLEEAIAVRAAQITELSATLESTQRVANSRGKLIKNLGWPESCPTPTPSPSPQPPV